MTQSILRLPQVKSRCGLGRSSIYEKIRKGEFPPPIAIGIRARGWLSDEIDQWIAASTQASREEGNHAPTR